MKRITAYPCSSRCLMKKKKEIIRNWGSWNWFPANCPCPRRPYEVSFYRQVHTTYSSLKNVGLEYIESVFIFLALFRYNWHITLWEFKIYILLWYIYILKNVIIPCIFFSISETCLCPSSRLIMGDMTIGAKEVLLVYTSF